MNNFYNSNNNYNENVGAKDYSELDIRDSINEDKMLDHNRRYTDDLYNADNNGYNIDNNVYGYYDVKDSSSKTKAIVVMALMAAVIVGVLGMTIIRSVGNESKQKTVQVDNGDTSADGGNSENLVGGQDSEVHFNEEQIEDTGDYVESEQDDPKPIYEEKQDVEATATPTPKPTVDPAIEINEVKEKVRQLSLSDNRVVGIYSDFSRYPLNLMKDIVRNHEMIDYTVGYLDGITRSYDENIDISGNVSDTTYKIPLLIQWDTRWGYYKYGKSTVGISGCGPTALNMVYLALKGDTSMNPLKMAKFSTDYGYCVPGVGTSWSLMTDGAAKLGITSTRLSKKEENMKTSLEQGKFIIASMGPGIFTEKGHFIVFSGYENGQFRINDPFSMEHSRRTWRYNEFASQVKALWVLSN